MAVYEDLCTAVFQDLPRREAIARTLRELPAKMKQAISDNLAAPTGVAKFPTGLFHCPTNYVDFYRVAIDQNGHRTRDREDCESDGVLLEDTSGVYNFCIGICLEATPGSYSAVMIYFTFLVEEFDENSVTLSIKNLDGQISISDVHDAASYGHAAKVAIDRLMEDLRDPTSARGSRAPIGFHARIA